MKRRILLIGLLLMILCRSNAQEILGTVVDQKKEPVINASVRVMQGGILKGESITDYDGKYNVKSLDSGLYDVTVSYTGKKTQTITGVVVTPGDKTELNFTLVTDRESQTLKCITIKCYKKPLVDKYKNNTILTAAEIRTKPTSSTTELVALTPGVYQKKRGADISPDGGHTTGNVYIIDGVQVQRTTGVNTAQGQTEQLSVDRTTYLNPSTEEYKRVNENDFMLVKASPLSTMSVDVDRASYSNIRRFITEGSKPPVDAVRIEEMINYFDYKYAQPLDDRPIAIQTELVECPWNNKHTLLRVGIQAKNTAIQDLPPSNLVFLVDVSGSMYAENRLPLLKQCLRLLVNNLRAQDRVSMVAYAGNAGLVLPSTAGDKKKTILEAIDNLEAGGSTAGGEGILLAYKIAKKNYIKGGNNRVILGTDGDFNVGVSNDNELEALIVKQRESGVFLTCLGFGEDNYKDAKMETLADKGNGNYDYIDNIQEAEKTLVKEFKCTMFTVAKDVKAQIEFNPEKVQSYRLIGYEDRVLNAEDFKDDKKDAGDMGAGHSVTILYELVTTSENNDEERATNDLRYQRPNPTPASFSNELATIKFRYKEPDDSVSKEMKHIIPDNVIAFNSATEDTRFASSVALFGMMLKDSKFKGNGTYERVLEIATASKGEDKDNYRKELIGLVSQAKRNSEKTTAK